MGKTQSRPAKQKVFSLVYDKPINKFFTTTNESIHDDEDDANHMALHDAAGKGDIQMVKKLIQAGTGVNGLTRNEYIFQNAITIPLLSACEGRRSEVLDSLIIAQDSYKEDKYLLAKRVERATLHYKKGMDPILCALRKRYSGIVEALLECGVSANSSICLRDGSKQWNISMLMLAVNYTDVKTTRILLKWGACVNYSISGSVVLPGYYANNYDDIVQDRLIEIIKLLILYEADVRKADLTSFDQFQIGITALTTAVKALDRKFGCRPWKAARTKPDQAREYILILYIAGASAIVRELIIRYRYQLKPLVEQIMAENPTQCFPLFSSLLRGYISLYDILPDKDIILSDICRAKIRDHLLNPSGGDQRNLITAVQKLPLPQRLKRYLLFDLDVSKWK